MADTVHQHYQAMLQLRLSNFTVAYQGIPAVVDLSLTLTAATVNLVTGVIGAGKTTLLRALSGMVGHTGSIELTEGARHYVSEGAGEIRQPLPRSLVSPYMSVSQFLQLALLKNAWQLPPDASERISDALTRCRLESLAHSPLSVLTPEQYRHAEVAQLFVQQPRVILLDEPSRRLSLESASSVLTCISKWVRDTRNIAVVADDGRIPADGVDRIFTLDHGRLMNP